MSSLGDEQRSVGVVEAKAGGEGGRSEVAEGRDTCTSNMLEIRPSQARRRREQRGPEKQGYLVALFRRK